MYRQIPSKINRIATNIFHSTANNRKRRRIIAKFADKIGLINFGPVNQISDEHKVVRGFTVSSSHKDASYCVGTIDDYNITIVDRKDAVLQTNGKTANYQWLVMAFELHTDKDLPHLFIGAHDKNPKPYELLFGTFPALQPVTLGTFENYHQDFTSRYTISSRHDQSIEIERLFPDNITRIIGEHFWPLSAEHHEGVLYIYSDKQNITPNLLGVMIENGLWLAGHLDRQAEII